MNPNIRFFLHITGTIWVFILALFFLYRRIKDRTTKAERREEKRHAQREAVAGIAELQSPGARDNEVVSLGDDQDDGSPRDSELTGVFSISFGTARAPTRVTGALSRRGKLHVTFSSLLLRAEARSITASSVITHGNSPGSDLTLRLNPATTRGVYDAERRIIALNDSARAKRWVLVRPIPNVRDPTREEAFTALIALLVAVLGNRLEPRELRGFSPAAFAKPVIALVIVLFIIAACVAIGFMLRELNS